MPGRPPAASHEGRTRSAAEVAVERAAERSGVGGFGRPFAPALDGTPPAGRQGGGGARRRRSVMRHFLRRALAPAMLAGGMQTPTAPRALVAASRRAHEGSAPQRVALRSAGDLPPIAARAQAHEATAVGAVEAADPGVDDGPRRRSPRRPDRAGRHSRCGPPLAPARGGLDGEAQGHSPVNAWASPTPTTRRFYRIPSCSTGFRSERPRGERSRRPPTPSPISHLARSIRVRGGAGAGRLGGAPPPEPP
jgi:hypothetical protein